MPTGGTLRAMTISKTPVYLDAELAREVAERAADRNEEPDVMVAEVLRRHFLLDVVEGIWARQGDGLSEEEALDLAYRELHAMRAERAAESG